MFVPSRIPAPPRAALSLALLLVALAGAGGCGDGRDGASSPTPTPGDPSLITGTGTVRHLDFEGGFWGIVADDSTRYDPGTLDERFQKDGLRVRFDARLDTAQMSLRQWGRLVTLVRIDPL